MTAIFSNHGQYKNAVKKQQARDLHEATVMSTLTAPARTTDTTALSVTATTTPKWCDTETVTLEQIDKNTWQLLRE